MRNEDKPKIKVIIFDLGNVIINFDWRRVTRKLVKYSELSEDEILANIPTINAIKSHEKGLISNRGLYQQVKGHLKLNIKRRKFESIWMDIFFENPHMIRLVKKIKDMGYKIAIISDTNPLHDKHELINFPILQKADYYFPSYKMKIRKAEGTKIFKLALKKLKIKPEEALFIDDLPRNVGFARKAGLKTIRFRGVQRLKTSLRRAGVYI